MTQCNVISMSGGKDSTATALKAIEDKAENIRFVFSDTGHEHQITYDHVDYLDNKLRSICGVGIDVVRADFTENIINKREKLITHFMDIESGLDGNAQLKGFTRDILERMIEAIKPTGNPFLDLCIWKGRFPSTRARFCSEELKHKPIAEYQFNLSNDFNAVISWQGVRRDESLARANLIEKDIEFGSWEPEPSGMLIYRPILEWKAIDTFEIAKRFGIEPNPLYKMGMGRVGCMPCIHATKQEVRGIESRFPEVVERVKWMEKVVSWASKRECSTFMDARVTCKYLGTGKTVNDIKYQTHGFGTYVEYARTEHGGRQQSLIAAIDLDQPQQCSSIYGLCE